MAEQRQLPCPCGHHAQYQELRCKSVLTIVGPVRVSRPYYLCASCGVGQFPVDASFSPPARLGGPGGALRSRPRTNESSGWPGGDHQIGGAHRGDHRSRHRSARTSRDPKSPAVGSARRRRRAGFHPVRADGWDGSSGGEEREVGRQGKTEGQPAHTREVKLGCVFTQTTWDQEGYPIRDPDSTTYTGAIESAEEFGRRIYGEAWRRGWSRALKKVVIGDGAEWIWNLVALHFSDAIQIVDLYHARQHLWEVARSCTPMTKESKKPG